MSAARIRTVVIVLVALHVLLVLSYSLPESMVQNRVRLIAQRYVRPLFHQQWNLFAPDPPLCACRIEVGLPDGTWHAIISAEQHYLVRRMARPLADHIHERIQLGDTVVLPILAEALRNATRDMATGSELRYRSVHRCVSDPAHPEERSLEIIDLVLP